MNIFQRLTLGAVAACFGIAPAHAVETIDFSNTGCTSSGVNCLIPQSYGDTGLVDVSYRTINTVTGVPTSGLFAFASGYGDLHDVVYGGTNGSTFLSEITLTAKHGAKISLESFDLASFGGARNAPVTVRDLQGNILSSLTVKTNGTHVSWTTGTDYLDGIVIRWGPDGYNVGLDNLSYTTLAAPEAGTWAMMVAGFGLLGISLRKRRRPAAFA
jgi:hypothetical protein